MLWLIRKATLPQDEIAWKTEALQTCRAQPRRRGEAMDRAEQRSTSINAQI